MQISDFWTSIQVSMGSRPHLSFCACKTAWLVPEWLVSKGPSPYLWFLHAKQRFCSRITSLYRSQTSPFVLCMQNSVISITITSLYGSQPSSVDSGCKTATFVPVSMGPRPHLSLCACKTAWLASENLVSMGPRPHLWFQDAKQRLLDPNNKSLWVPDITCRYVLAKQRD